MVNDQVEKCVILALESSKCAENPKKRMSGHVRRNTQQNAGLDELIATSSAPTASLAGNRDRLVELRFAMRARMKNSLLMDAARFTRNLEAAYRGNMAGIMCEG